MSRDESYELEEEVDEEYLSTSSASSTDQADDDANEMPDDDAEVEDEATDEESQDGASAESDEEQESEGLDVRTVELSELPAFERVPETIGPDPDLAVNAISLSGEPTEEDTFTVQTLKSSVTHEVEDNVRAVRPQAESKKRNLGQVHVDDITIKPMPDRISESVQVGGEIIELEDPFHWWEGSVPYDTGEPSVVLHVSPESKRGNSLALLERRLRDEYTQQRGGQPTAKRVRMVAKKPKLPDISGTISIFDLTDDAWELDTSSSTVSVERNGRDALSYIEQIVNTSFSGEPGYLIVNLPEDWKDPIAGSNIFDRIHMRLSPEYDGNATDRLSDSIQTDEIPVVTRCKPTNPDAFHQEAGLYWFGDSSITEGKQSESIASSVEGYEDQFERALHRTDWLSTVITEQDESESDEHYLFKSSIASRLTRHLYTEAKSTTGLQEFVFEEILSDSALETEYILKSSKENYTVDCRVRWDSSLDAIIPKPETSEDLDSVLIEIETGRGQAGANFRKIWHTIDRLSDSSDAANSLICVVVPPRLLAKTNVQANHLTEIVEVWNRRVEFEDNDLPAAILTIPVLDDEGSCVALKTASEFVDEVYNDE